MSESKGHPICARCGSEMDFHRVDSGLRGFENHVYECGHCFTMKAMQVRLSTVHDTAVRWARSSLRGPV